MRERLVKILARLSDLERNRLPLSPLHRLDPRAKLIVCLAYLVMMLSTPLTSLSELMLYTIYPLWSASRGALNMRRIFRQSLLVVPLVAFIGFFNLLFDHRPLFMAGDVVVTQGAVTFVAIILRGVLSVAALLVMIHTTGYHRLCLGMQQLGLPPLIALQLLFVYRYTYVLLREAIIMSTARDARNFGRGSYPLKMWGLFIEQLLLRSFERAEWISRAMLSRGFDGKIPSDSRTRGRWTRLETLYTAVWCLLFLAIRLLHPAERLFSTF